MFMILFAKRNSESRNLVHDLSASKLSAIEAIRERHLNSDIYLFYADVHDAKVNSDDNCYHCIRVVQLKVR